MQWRGNVYNIIFEMPTFVPYDLQEYETDVDENTRQFILDQNTETRNVIKNDVSWNSPCY